MEKEKGIEEQEKFLSVCMRVHLVLFISFPLCCVVARLIWDMCHGLREPFPAAWLAADCIPDFPTHEAEALFVSQIVVFSLLFPLIFGRRRLLGATSTDNVGWTCIPYRLVGCTFCVPIRAHHT